MKNDPKSSSQQPKHVENGHQAPVTSTGYRSRVAFEGPAAGGEALKIYIYIYIYMDLYIDAIENFQKTWEGLGKQTKLTLVWGIPGVGLSVF